MSGDSLGALERCPNASWLSEFAELNREDREAANFSRAPLAATEAEKRFVVATALGKACKLAPDCQLGPEEYCPIDRAVVIFAFEAPPMTESGASV